MTLNLLSVGGERTKHTVMLEPEAPKYNFHVTNFHVEKFHRNDSLLR